MQGLRECARLYALYFALPFIMTFDLPTESGVQLEDFYLPVLALVAAVTFVNVIHTMHHRRQISLTMMLVGSLPAPILPFIAAIAWQEKSALPIIGYFIYLGAGALAAIIFAAAVGAILGNKPTLPRYALVIALLGAIGWAANNVHTPKTKLGQVMNDRYSSNMARIGQAIRND